MTTEAEDRLVADDTTFYPTPRGPYVKTFYGGTLGAPTYTTSEQQLIAGRVFDYPCHLYVFCCTAAGVANSKTILLGLPGNTTVPLAGSATPYYFRMVSPSLVSFRAQASPAATDQVSFMWTQENVE